MYVIETVNPRTETLLTRQHQGIGQQRRYALLTYVRALKLS